MKDSISRKWLTDVVEEYPFDTQEDKNRIIHLVRDTAPPAEGKWIKTRFWTEGCGMGEIYGYYYKCSNCKKEVKGEYPFCGYDYCPYCGASMEDE